MKMPIPFQLSALPASQFTALHKMTDEELARHGAKRCVADANPGYPCRVSLEDAEVGETLILLPYVHHETPSPYRSSGPIFVRSNAQDAKLAVNEVPDSVRRRLLSVRGYDADGFLIDAEVIEGQQIESVIEKLFADRQIAYLHVHNARPGCYNCRIDRA